MRDDMWAEADLTTSISVFKHWAKEIRKQKNTQPFHSRRQCKNMRECLFHVQEVLRKRKH